MEKLVKLLNEYRTEKGERNLNEFEVSQTLDSLNYLRSFIKRLVKNDKIDLDKVNFDEREVGMDMFSNFYKKDIVIMLLSIQDNPIEYLCSILK